MRLKIQRYNYDVNSLHLFRTLISNLDGGVYNAINLFVGEDERFKKWLVKVNWDDALAGSAIVLFRILELHKPEDNDKARIDSVIQLINEFSDKASPKLSALTAAVTADIFDFLALRKNSEAMTYLADELIKNATTEAGLNTIQLILAPKTALDSSVSTTLYPELRKAVERQGEFATWFEAHIPKNLKLRAYKSTQFDEARVNATKRQRGEMLEMAMGL
jgi:hypothetical protein